ncbi:A/G-specific adenine glycosylase [Phycicoccus badiiscoriae]|uniref:Adenine DNA glycosylase n=1 Tax=Pedococcus badiiscoriae TaxID=642776 RepID=A0A852WB60_9MICO|nr:A/G-specific adenine glycosylase [Pedococcus badiiscoriae]
MNTGASPEQLHHRVLDWYAVAARDLPWRRPDCTPWGIFVSEVMLQQTPVVRVEPVWREWMSRWPTPADLAADSPGEAVRAWGRLGYPRRALRLHAAAVAMTDRHAGTVPATEAELLALPGVGTYTAAAVATFAFGERTTVVDTNVRRVLARVVTGQEYAAPSPTRAELTVAADLVPADAATARTWSVALMELGALVCSARSPRCSACPVADLCAWQVAGRPAYRGPARKGQAWEGTDRQLRGALLAALRASHTPVPRSALESLSDNEIQRERCLDSLVADGLVEPLAGGRYRLPASREAS